jgi:hypothetical protein
MHPVDATLRCFAELGPQAAGLSITRVPRPNCLAEAGFHRTGSSRRYVDWYASTDHSDHHLVGALPTWLYSAGWGYYPTGGVGLLLIIVVILLLMGRL